MGRHTHGSHHNISHSGTQVPSPIPHWHWVLRGEQASWTSLRLIPFLFIGCSPQSLVSPRLVHLFPLSYVLNSPLEWAHPNPLSILLSLCVPRLFPFVTFRATTSASCHSKLANLDNGPLWVFISNRKLLYSPKPQISALWWRDWWDEGWGRRELQEGGDICMHIADSLHCKAETNVEQLHSNKKESKINSKNNLN